MRSLPRLTFLYLCALVTLAGFTVSVNAGDMPLKMVLIWGTDEEHPADKSLKPANPETVAQFREVCKWKYYFEVTNTVTALSPTGTNKIRLSPKCEVEVSNHGAEGIAAKFYGENKLIYSGKSKVETGKHWGIGGNDKNATAWFVILTPLAKP
jgi:hypothetical protein